MPKTHPSRLPFASNLTGIPTQNVISLTNSFRPRVYTPTNPRDANNVSKTNERKACMQSKDICVGSSIRAEQSPVAGVEVVPLVAGAAPIVVGGPVVSLYQNKQCHYRQTLATN